MQDEPQEVSSTLLSSLVGLVMAVFAMLLSIGVVPMLFFARDSLDLTGGLAGGAVIVILFLVGLVLILQDKTPDPLARAFFFINGGLGVVIAVGILYWAVYCVVTGIPINLRAFAAPFLFGGLGVIWLRAAFHRVREPAAAIDNADEESV